MNEGNKGLNMKLAGGEQWEVERGWDPPDRGCESVVRGSCGHDSDHTSSCWMLSPSGSYTLQLDPKKKKWNYHQN